MAKINKIFPPFYNGITEQPPELALDNQCKDMINCIPDVVSGLTKRPPLKYVASSSSLLGAKVVHTYDRGEDDEEYIFLYTGNSSSPLAIYDKNGVGKTVAYNSTNEAVLKEYLNGSNLKGLTVQDRTYIVNKDKIVISDTTGQTAPDINYDKAAYYWLRRGSGDKYNPYNYAVYLDGVLFESYQVVTIPGTDQTTPPSGHEQTTIAAQDLADLINDSPYYTCDLKGSLLKITRNDGSDFTFDSWDSWGNQASEGWKGSVNKITDLPNDFSWIDTYVEVGGDDKNEFTKYYVKWNGSTWQETRNPDEVRGILTNMPIKIDRQVDGSFLIDIIDWQEPSVGNLDSNPDPSFVGSPISDIFFYKNRLGISSSDSIVLTEAGGYENFYIQTALDITDTDPIDVAIASNKASKIYYVKPFQNSLFLFTKDSQFEMISEGYTSPTTVSINNISSYPMSTLVEPVVVNNSLFFVSKTNNKQQLREYIKDENTLVTKGIDLSLVVPNLLSETITRIVTNGVLGYVLLTTTSNLIYAYMMKDNGSERIQSSWSKWTFLNGLTTTANSFEYFILDSDLLVMCKTSSSYIYHKMDLTKDSEDYFVDISIGGNEYNYMSTVVLPDWYPHLIDLGTSLEDILIKKVTIEGTGRFSAEVYRPDYDTVFNKSYTDTSMKDLDLHVNSKVSSCEIRIKDETTDDFKVKSIVMEGVFTPTSKEIK